MAQLQRVPEPRDVYRVAFRPSPQQLHGPLALYRLSTYWLVRDGQLKTGQVVPGAVYTNEFQPAGQAEATAVLGAPGAGSASLL